MHDWAFPEKLAFLAEPHRYKVAYGGRGGAKSWGFARQLLIDGWEKPIRVLCAREVQDSIKDSVHKLLSDQIEAMGLGYFYTILRDEIRGANGTQFIFTGLSKMTTESIKSYEGVDRCWVEEAQKVSRRSWDILTPTIRKDGSEIWISLNPELDTDETWTRFVENPPPGAKVVEINFSDNPFLPAVLKDEHSEFKRQVELGKRDQDDYENIWQGKTKAALPGSIYHKEITAAKLAGRLCNVPYDPLLKVHTIWDLGFSDYMSILCVQRHVSEIRIIRYVEDRFRTYASYVEQLNGYHYNWGQDWLPWDGKTKGAESGRSPQAILKALGRDCPDDESTIVEQVGVENGIKAARQIFPRVYFDKENAGLLFSRLGKYKRVINQRTGMGGNPEHDENSHGADGFRYLAVCEPKLTNESSAPPVDPYRHFRRAG
jgi:phage terminase large subunit